MRLYSIKDGEILLKAVRDTVELHISSRKFKSNFIEKQLEKFNEQHGVFVTIKHYPTNTLRGCIGFPITQMPLSKSLVAASIAAASEDPRFVPVSHMEFEHMVVELSILSKPEKIKSYTPRSISRYVKVGRDGLMLEYGFSSGLLLPIVPVEEDWNVQEFMNNLCLKAGLDENTWKEHKVVLYKFTSQVFRELSPRGPTEEIVFE